MSFSILSYCPPFLSNRRRDKRGLSRPKLCEILGFSKGGYCKWEEGISLPTVSNLVKLADFYGVSTDSLLGRVRES